MDKEYPLKESLIYLLKKISKFWSNLKLEYKNYQSCGIFDKIKELIQKNNCTIEELNLSALEIPQKEYKKKQIKLLYKKSNCTKFSRHRSYELVCSEILNIFEKLCLSIR